ncbi:Demethylrebeccamycin-D-glucose O-methyltransferase [Poriferisphaera corsica]|uniref:Demethylrebeccamycin-D-glucose O-methyltransferase n=1 Tax=Poriferisphaera corsica TaxID=2528020 RepID=A0A517YTX4_9BACT|nr:class I SAM-dependent methyltransferase [Poriferisphaera corsica]QDU33685.1 Demethylrebeccamycin-D-glucose O-methyltransferase [Poriferisphaera corsica]
MDDYKLLIDLHIDGTRQGPGGEAETNLAMTLAGLDRSKSLRILDIGCGTGASTIQLAKELDAEVVAVDFLEDFLEALKKRANGHGVADRIETLNCSMDALQFEDEAFDVIWSEGAIYNMGFENGIAEWKRLIKPGGIMVVSEITWLSETRPNQLQAYWEGAYAEIDTASAKINALERHGYCPKGYFYLQPHCWLENYYMPMRDRFPSFIERYDQNDESLAIVEAEKEEIALYEKYHSYYSYGVYVAQKI